MGIDEAPPNGLRFTRAALIDRDVVRAHLDAKIAPILSTRSGVGCKRGLGRCVGKSYHCNSAVQPGKRSHCGSLLRLPCCGTLRFKLTDSCALLLDNAIKRAPLKPDLSNTEIENTATDKGPG